MSSRRFPGKVLERLRGKPVLRHLLDRLARVSPRDRIVVATSEDPSDDPLAAYVRESGHPLFRGPLDDVFLRFRRCLEAHPCDWFHRISADSPLFDETLVPRFEEIAGASPADLITNVFPRSFPKGHSLETVRAATFLKIDGPLTLEQKEHVTKYFYENPTRFRIQNVSSGTPELAMVNLCVDTIEDLRRLEERGE